MPEGHLLHRHAAEQTADLAGDVLAVSSPQGRFAAEAAALDGSALTGVSAHGKNLLYAFPGDRWVHVHLGMRGLFLRHPGSAPAPPRGGVRVRLCGPRATYDLIAPSTCALVDAAGRDRLLAGLGPDPLGPGADVQEAVRRLRAARGAVGVALLDQAVWAGVGNAFRAEVLFLTGCDPALPASALTEDEARLLWDVTRAEMAVGREVGALATVDHESPGTWVYRQETCRRCGSPVTTAEVAGRTVHRCPVDQPPGAHPRPPT